MPQFGKNSRTRRDTCEPKLIEVLDYTIQRIDCSVIWGHRGHDAQQEAFRSGASKLRWPLSNHNASPSKAVDVIPWPTGYDSIPEFYELASYMFAGAAHIGVHLKWGGHWKNYTGKGDQDRDWAHWEIHND